MKIFIFVISFILASGSFAQYEAEDAKKANLENFQEEQEAPDNGLENLYDRKDNKMIDNPRNPAMVKGFQEVGSGDKQYSGLEQTNPD